ncbi:MAG: hypothetical protein EXR58_06755 [Chloroflexi bacterium]|nr:hypothetical protein [Chloroflexota bacterium]
MVAIFASYFWLWTIIGLLLLLLLYTMGSLLSFVGFMTPVRALGQKLEAASPRARLLLLPAFIGALAYPSAVHTLWANATAMQIREQFQAIPAFPDSQQTEPSEQFAGLYDPGGSSGAYITDWFGTRASPDDVRAYYRRVLTEKGWVEAPNSGASTRFVDVANPQSHYELLIAVPPSGNVGAPQSLAGQPTTYALRFGAVDPRVTTQVAWFVDCLVRAAPTFPTCEAKGWHPLESAGALPGGRLPAAR